MEKVLDLNTILLSLRNKHDKDELYMNLMLLDSVKSYQYFNQHEVKQMVSVLLDVIYDNAGSYRWNIAEQKREFYGGIEVFGQTIYTRSWLYKNPKLAKMSPHKQVKYLTKRLLDSLKNSIFADDN